MGDENLAEFGAAEISPDALEEHLRREAAGWLVAKPEDVLVHFEGLLPDTAREDMTPEELESAAKSMQNALATGIWGWFDDDMASIMDWGFDPASIEVPVAIWHAGENDKFIPTAHGKWLAKAIPHATFYVRPKEDHISLGKQFDKIFDSLLAVAG
jgi:pimeloyl-ACP methyl ester carboxylesterase